MLSVPKNGGPSLVNVGPEQPRKSRDYAKGSKSLPNRDRRSTWFGSTARNRTVMVLLLGAGIVLSAWLGLVVWSAACSDTPSGRRRLMDFSCGVCQLICKTEAELKDHCYTQGHLFVCRHPVCVSVRRPGRRRFLTRESLDQHVGALPADHPDTESYQMAQTIMEFIPEISIAEGCIEPFNTTGQPVTHVTCVLRYDADHGTYCWTDGIGTSLRLETEPDHVGDGWVLFGMLPGDEGFNPLFCTSSSDLQGRWTVTPARQAIRPNATMTIHQTIADAQHVAFDPETYPDGYEDNTLVQNVNGAGRILNIYLTVEKIVDAACEQALVGQIKKQR